MITLGDISTRELVAAMRTDGNRYCSDGEWDIEISFSFKRMRLGGIEETVRASREEIRAELNGREHVPNKKQAATLRKICAEKGCSKEEAWSKYGSVFFLKDRQVVTKEYYKTIVRYYGKQSAAKRFVIK